MDWSLAVSVYKDEAVLNSTLLRSPALQRAKQVLCQRDYPTVAAAYNAALRECAADVLVFAHPDVFLPEAWGDSLDRSLAWLNERDPQWGVAGVYGVCRDGSTRGFAYSTGLSRFLGAPFAEPSEIRTLDEFVFAVRRESGLEFDEKIPGAQSQLCTTDLCLQAEQRGLHSYALPCFVVHNSNTWTHLPLSFWKLYLYMRKKWRHVLPVTAPYSKLTVACLPMVANTVRGFIQGRGGVFRVATRVPDPAALYERLRRDVISAFGAPVAPCRDESVAEAQSALASGTSRG